MSGLKLPYKRVVQRGLERYATMPQLDFEDAIGVEHMMRLGITEILSYDRDFDRVVEIDRQEP